VGIYKQNADSYLLTEETHFLEGIAKISSLKYVRITATFIVSLIFHVIITSYTFCITWVRNGLLRNFI
jgi:hypothetical protein